MSGEYPNNWDQIATAVKTLAGWRCERCGHPHDPKGEIPCDDLCDMNYKHPKGKRRGLTVHHLDGDKSNCATWNLAALCQACHLQIQVKVTLDQMWMGEHSRWFMPHLFGYLLIWQPEATAHAINLLARAEYSAEASNGK